MDESYQDGGAGKNGKRKTSRIFVGGLPSSLSDSRPG